MVSAKQRASDLPERQRLILKEIVDRYIRYREPVSSRMILEDYGLPVSSATVRNDMNDLEAGGYIEKPYSSSGRIPTKKGYRFFVDWLLDLSDLTRQDRMEIVETYTTRCVDVKETIRQTAFLLGNLTGYAGFVLPPRLEETRLDRVVMIRIGDGIVFLAVVCDIGVVEHGLIPLDDDLSADEIRCVMDTVNETLRGATLEEVRSRAAADGPDGWYERTTRQALVAIRRLLERRLQRRTHFEGLLNLAEALQEVLPDRAMERFAGLSRAVQDEDAFIAALRAARGDRPGLVVNIGDIELSGLEEFSVVSREFRPHAGVLGVIAPLWMDYGRALSMTSYIANRLETLLVTSTAKTLEKDVV